MKKNFLWTMAAFFVSGLAFTACQVEDNPNPNPVAGDVEDLWNKTTTTYDFEDGENTVFTATSRMSVEIQDNAEKGSKVLALKNAGNTQNGYGFTYFNIADKVGKSTKITIKFDYFNGAGRGCITIGDALVRGTDGKGAGMDRINRAPFYGSKGAILRVGASSDGKNYVVNDDVLGTADEWCNKWLNVEVGVYTIDRKVEWVIKEGEDILAQSGTTEGEGEDILFTPGQIDYWQADADDCTQIDVFGFLNNNISYIDNLSITNAQDPTIKYADDVKIMFVDADGNELKEAKTISARVGSIVKLAGTDMASFYNADKTKKYIYASDNTETTPVAESGTVIKVVFRDAEIYYAVLNCNDENGNLLERFNDVNKYWFFEGDNLEIYPPRGYTKDGSVFFADATLNYNAVKVSFPGEISPTTAGGKTYYIGTLTYKKDANAVYYSDIERLALPKEDAGNGVGLGQLFGTVNSWYSFSGSPFDRFSCYRGIRLDVDSYVWTEPIAEAGTYTVTIYGRNDSNDAAEPPYVLGLRDAEGNVTWIEGLTYTSWGGAVTGSNTVENVTIPAGSSLVIKNDDAAKLVSLDDITISKPAAAE
jgi:hypothetical protein